MRYFICVILVFLIFGCTLNGDPKTEVPDPTVPVTSADEFVRGADLSYTNEMLECDAQFFNATGVQSDPYQIFGNAGTNIARFRLWHSPTWTAYSNFADVQLGIARAKSAGMDILLDFHYSDTWADPSKQEIPAAWLPFASSPNVLSDSVYRYTYNVLKKLSIAGLLPQYVQIGNEINIEILQDPNQSYNLNWNRNAKLINSGIQAVRDLSAELDEPVQIMLHIAQPENALWWFREAAQNGITDFDWLGVSYYPAWSTYNLNRLTTAISTLIQTHQKKLMIVETAYPFTLEDADGAGNILGKEALVPGFPASENGQFDFMMALEEAVKNGGGSGIIYWEPAWISTSCYTQWGQGSHWDNATLFDLSGRALKGITYFGQP